MADSLPREEKTLDQIAASVYVTRTESQLESKDDNQENEAPRNGLQQSLKTHNIELSDSKPLGKGNFGKSKVSPLTLKGEVWIGIMDGQEVAVKVLQTGADSKAKQELQQELGLLGL